MEDYPPPCPPLKKKSDIFNISDFLDIDRRAREAPDKFLHSFESLVAYLTTGLTSDLAKLRSLFTWMGSRDLIHEGAYPMDVPDNTPYYFLQLITKRGGSKETCILFEKLCREAGLQCEVVSGCSKNYHGYFVGDTIRYVNHHWVVVHVEGSWQIVELTFVGCVGATSHMVMIEDSGAAVRQREKAASGKIQTIREDRFLPDPENFIYTYFPEDPKWQLLLEPWSRTKFLQTAVVTRRYLQSSWHLSDVHNAVIRTRDGRCGISFDQIPDGEYAIRYRLYYNEEKSKKQFPNELQATNYIKTVGGKDQQAMVTRLPLTGVYLLKILDSTKATLCEVSIHYSGEQVNNAPFPTVPDTGLGINQKAIDGGLVDISREDGLLVAREGEKIRFQFRTKKALAVVTRLLHAAVPSEELQHRVRHEQEGNLISIEVEVPWHAQNPEYCLQVDVRPEEESEASLVNVLNYLLTHDKGVVHIVRGKERQVKGELESAIADVDAYRLESAIREYRTEHMEMNDCYMKACYRLCELYRMEVQNSLQDRGRLEAVLTDVEQSQVAYMMHGAPWLGQAQQTLRSMRRLDAMRDKVQTLTGKQISEIQTYNHPSQNIQAAVRATYLLLGEMPKKLKKWKQVQALLRCHGRDAILYRIKNHDVSLVTTKHVEKASALLSSCSQDDICCQSLSAAALYNWSKALVDMMMTRNNDNYDVMDSQQQHQSHGDVIDNPLKDQDSDDVIDSEQQDRNDDDDVIDSEQQDQNNDDVSGDQAATLLQKDDNCKDTTIAE